MLIGSAITAATVWAADLAALAIKAATGRPRPFEVLPQADPLLKAAVGQSMPSGHAATSFAGAVILAYLTRRAVAGLFLLAVAISFSRVYVGVHYPSDVVVGALLGTAVGLAAAALVARALRRPSALRPRSGSAPPPG